MPLVWSKWLRFVSPLANVLDPRVHVLQMELAILATRVGTRGVAVVVDLAVALTRALLAVGTLSLVAVVALLRRVLLLAVATLLRALLLAVVASLRILLLPVVVALAFASIPRALFVIDALFLVAVVVLSLRVTVLAAPFL